MLQSTEQLWQDRWNHFLEPLTEHTREMPEYPAGWSRLPRQKLHLKNPQNFAAVVVGAADSKALNSWGVQLQRVDHWPEAGTWFRRALLLNPDNLSAQINALYNERCVKGDRTRLDSASIRREFSAIFAKYPGLYAVISEGGPIDEPTFLLNIGRILLDAGCARQAAADFLRSAELAPDWPSPTLWLAQSSIQLGA